MFQQTKRLLVLALTAATAACSASDLAVPNPNQPTPEGAASNPRQSVQFLATGIVRTDAANYGAYGTNFGSFGRETYFIFLTDTRQVTGWYRDFNLNTSFSSGFLGGFYGQIKNLQAVDSIVTRAPAGTFTAGELLGITGFSKTEEALNLFYQVRFKNCQTVDCSASIPTRVDPDPTKVTPFVSRDSAYTYVANTLDAGYAALTTAGAALPFSIPIAGFNSVASLAQLNRAIKAKVEVNRGAISTGAARTALYNSALTALGQSYLNAPVGAGNRLAGPVYNYSTAAGEVANPFLVTTSTSGVYMHPSIQLEPEFGTDPRITAYVVVAPTANQAKPAGSTDSTRLKMGRFPGTTAVIPWLTNEELVLIRAEARWFTGNTAGAIADLGGVRTSWGLSATGVPNAAPTTDAQFIDNLLHERRFSLIGFAERWFDMRRFGRLATLPNSGTTFLKTANQIVSQAECLSRTRTGDAALACPTYQSRDPQNPGI